MKTKYVLVFILLGMTQSFAAEKTTTKSKTKEAVHASSTTAVQASAIKQAKPRVVPAKGKTSNLTTDAKFNDQSVGGKYQLPMEALSVVENEKAIDDLIGVRQNFQDRVARTKGMR